MAAKTRILPILLLVAVAAGAAGFGASYFRDNRVIQRLTAERDVARDCRQSGATVAPCPVVYRNTQTVWRDRVETVRAPDPKQGMRIVALSAELAHDRRTIRNLEHPRIRPRASAGYGVQNGTILHPYNTADRCPAGSSIVYDTSLAGRRFANRGDPNVCYVVMALHRLALSSPRH
jgi:hypothetical protein